MGDPTFRTAKCRLSYPHFYEAFRYSGSDPEKEKEYSVVMMFPKTKPTVAEEEDLKELQWRINQARDAEFKDPATHAGMNPASFIKDGDAPGAKPEYAGYWTIRAKTKESRGAPPVFDVNAKVIPKEEAHRIYAGCWGKVAVSTYAWRHASGGYGVKLNLDGFQLFGDGERIVPRPNLDEVFTPVPAEEAMANDGWSPPSTQEAPAPTQAPPVDEAPPWA